MQYKNKVIQKIEQLNIGDPVEYRLQKGGKLRKGIINEIDTNAKGVEIYQVREEGTYNSKIRETWHYADNLKKI